MVEALLLYGFATELRRGGRQAAQRASAAALDHWVELGLPYATGKGCRRFDPVEVLNFLKWAGLRGVDPFWEERFITTGRGLTLGFHPGAAPDGAPPPGDLGPLGFSVTLQREFTLPEGAAGRSVLLRLPLPLEDAALRDLKVTPLAPPDLDARFTVAPGRLDARLVAAQSRSLVLGVEISFTAHPAGSAKSSGSLASPEVELYTRSSEGIVQVSPRIRSLASELAGEERDRWRVVRRFWDFILGTLTCGGIHYDQLDAARPTDWPLESGWYDCHLGSALLVALCRARRIPARIVSGYLIYAPSASYHYWAEVWIDDRGWAPFDLLSSDLSARGRDPSWRYYFAGALDYRMKTQCLPRLFNLAPSIRFPPVWYALARAGGEGTELATFATDTGALVYRERIRVRHG
ncbi:MAG TPA: transglutaminase-like domain-containing protein [Casimicrobiaceae bacterium]|nr:transglutaminase-like domain-containing protein [Casimicrobiaceae bacterium]